LAISAVILSVGRSVGPLVGIMNMYSACFARMAKEIELPVVMMGPVRQKSDILDGGPDPPMGRGKFWGKFGGAV